MGRDYNAAIAGYNAKIRDRMNHFFACASRLHELDKNTAAALAFKKVNIHPVFLMSDEHLEVLDLQTPEALKIIEEIEKTREILVKSVLKSAASVAHTRFKMLSGEVVDFSDLLQEALLEAFEATLVFDIKNKKVKWPTFVYQRMFNSLGKYISENSRTVPLPRTLLDQYAPIQKAILKVGLSDYEALAEEATRINAKSKMDTKGRKLKPREIYTPKKVEYFLSKVNDWMSLDITVNENAEENREVSLIDTLSVDGYEAEVSSEREMCRRSLQKLLSEYFGDEYPVLALRWGLDDEFPVPLEPFEIQEVYKYREPGVKLHQVRIKAIEENAMKLLKAGKIPELREVWDAYNSAKTKEE
jgi:DNA-directed RNA polymerase sigma subunit (sigma70/sigma32)